MTFEREPLEALTIIWKLAAVKTFWVKIERMDTTGVLRLGVSVEVESTGVRAYWLLVTIWMVRVVWLANPLILAREIVKFAVPPARIVCVVGDIPRLKVGAFGSSWLATRLS